jgi:hypothetical protein
MFPGAKGILDDEADDVEEDAGPSQDRGEGVDRDITVKDDESSEHHRRVSERVRTAAEQSEPRFTENDHIDAASAASTGTPRPNAFGRDNARSDRSGIFVEPTCVTLSFQRGWPIGHSSDWNEMPAAGEDDTAGGRENSRD